MQEVKSPFNGILPAQQAAMDKALEEAKVREEAFYERHGVQPQTRTAAGISYRLFLTREINLAGRSPAIASPVAVRSFVAGFNEGFSSLVETTYQAQRRVADLEPALRYALTCVHAGCPTVAYEERCLKGCKYIRSILEGKGDPDDNGSR